MTDSPPTAPQQGSETARDAPRNDAVPAVRFSSAVEEISPSANANRVGESEAENDSNVFNDVAEDQMKAFSKPVRGQDLQERRLSTFNFEAFSLPPSRVSRHHACYAAAGSLEPIQKLIVNRYHHAMRIRLDLVDSTLLRRLPFSLPMEVLDCPLWLPLL